MKQLDKKDFHQPLTIVIHVSRDVIKDQPLDGLNMQIMIQKACENLGISIFGLKIEYLPIVL